ncbi:MAG: hypothetical protein NVS2B17_05900 [Candidatus Velthaea sp.]
MILSVHVPKAAGNSFREALQSAFGDRIMRDYGDWAGFDHPEANERRALRTARMREQRDELLANYDAIHGHFVADKYCGLFPTTHFVAFFRDPFQQAVAHYDFLRRNPQRDHPEERIFHEAKMTLLDYLRWDAFRDQQSQFLGSVPIEDFTMVGLSGEYARSLALFRSIFGKELGPERFDNVNPTRPEGEYSISAEIRTEVERNRSRDIELYRRACEIFAKQTARAGV